jgi:hypothetical protein
MVIQQCYVLRNQSCNENRYSVDTNCQLASLNAAAAGLFTACGSQRGVRRESSQVARSSNKVSTLADYPGKCL